MNITNLLVSTVMSLWHLLSIINHQIYLYSSILGHPVAPVSITHRRQIPEYIHLIFFNCPLSSRVIINFSELRSHLSHIFCINTQAPGRLSRSASGLTSSSSG